VKSKIFVPANCSGPLSECLKRDPQLTESAWHRGQMRSWAGYWRDRHAIAAILGKKVSEVADTYLSLAKSYRDSARKMEVVK
jgi:hypothetical protein